MRESELIILLTGARHEAHAEFDIHQGEALRSGLTMDIISAIPRDEGFSLERVESDLLPLLAESERDVAIARFTAELLETSTISEETYQATLKAVNGKESVLVEITSIIGYYTYVAYTLNAFNIPFVRTK
jgi:4-carboxymuconolactone decarboxylase